MYKFEYSRPDVTIAVILSREQAIVELQELKGYISHIQILDETESDENHGEVFVAVHLDDPTYDDWFTFVSKEFSDSDLALAFVTEAGCERYVED